MSQQPPPAAIDLVATAFGRALDEVADTGGPLAPMAVYPTNPTNPTNPTTPATPTAAGRDGIELRRFASDGLEESLAVARRELATAARDFVLVWDGYLTVDEWRTDALYAHLELADEATAHLFAWRYGLDEFGEVGPLEPAMYLGEDGRYDQPGRSHPLPPGEGPVAPHGQVLRTRRRWFRRR